MATTVQLQSAQILAGVRVESGAALRNFACFGTFRRNLAGLE